MRQFVCLGHEAPTTPSFSLDDLAGGAGRLDALCRSLTAALLRSHGIREDVRVHLVLQDELTIVVDGSEARRLNPDERSTAARIRTALEHRDEAIGAMPAEPSPGFEVYRRGFEATLEALPDDSTIVHLQEDGNPLVEHPLPEHPAFVLSDHGDFTDADLDVLAAHADRRVRLGPVALHADQAITVAHHALDTHGYETF